MPLLVGESIAVCRKPGSHKLQTDRSVGILESYLPPSQRVKGESLDIFLEQAVAGNQNISPISRPAGWTYEFENGPEREFFEEIFCTARGGGA